MASEISCDQTVQRSRERFFPPFWCCRNGCSSPGWFARVCT